MTTLETSSTLRRHAQASVDCATMFIAAAALYILLPSFAFAGGTADLSNTLSNVGEQASVLPKFLQYIFYIVGIALVGRGLMNGKKLSEDPRGGILSALGPLGVGGLMIALPSTADLVYSSIYDNSGTGTDPNFLVAGTASGATVGASIMRFTQEAFSGPANILTLVAYICYVVSIVLFGTMLQGAYKISTGGQGAPQVSGIVWRGIGAALLMVLPSATELLRKSLTDSPSARHNLALSSVTPAGAGDQGLDAALIRLVTDVKDPVLSLAFMVAFFFGVLIVAQTLYAMSGVNFEKQQLSPAQMITRLVFGGLLMSSWSLYQIVTTTVLNFTTIPNATASTLAWSQEALNGATATRVNNAMNAVLVWVQMVGVIAFLRGWFTLKGSLDGSANAPKSAGLTQVIAGALCINMPSTVKMIQNTLGVTIIT
jgi:hypothetical protein